MGPEKQVKLLLTVSHKSPPCVCVSRRLGVFILQRKQVKVKVRVYPMSVEPYYGPQASYSFVDAHGILSA